MSFPFSHPHGLYSADVASFTPLFRMLDDFDSYAREVQGADSGRGARRNGTHRLRFFHPKFDVRETENAYELHGELPGIDREHVHIEFTEPQTMVIRGSVERTYTAGTPPAGLLGGNIMSGAITEQGEEHHASHAATVTEEADEAAKEKGAPAAAEEGGKAMAKAEKQQKPAEKYWVSERSVGEFSRTFTFPGRVDQDAVSAGLHNGILSVTVPKAKKHESRRIAVN